MGICVKRILQDAGRTTELKISGILDHWLKNDLNTSWPTLVKALKEMNHPRLAEKLAKEYCNQGGRYTKSRRLNISLINMQCCSCYLVSHATHVQLVAAYILPSNFSCSYMLSVYSMCNKQVSYAGLVVA